LAGLPVEFKFRCAMNPDHPDENACRDLVCFAVVSAAKRAQRNARVSVPS
jgi:hypothetical protein